MPVPWRTQRKQRERERRRRPRGYLCGVIPLPHCLYDPNPKRSTKEVALRPGVDVCGMCMDNK